MNQQLERRLRKLEQQHAKKLNRSHDIRIIWATASQIRGRWPRKDPDVALDSSGACDEPTLDDEKINDDS